MMEHTTDRLFWTLTSIIVGALLLTVGAKAFPHAANSIMSPMSGVMKQADIATGHVGQANKDSLSKLIGNTNSNASSSNDDTSAKANAVEASTLGFKVVDNGDGTGTITGYDINKGTNANIPEYLNENGKTLKITKIGDWAFMTEYESDQPVGITSLTLPNTLISIGENAITNNPISSITLPNSLKTIRNNAFELSPITSIVIPDSVETIGDSAFINSNLTSITIGKSVKSIGSYSFGYVYAKSVTIPKSVNLSSDAFASAPTKINRS